MPNVLNCFENLKIQNLNCFFNCNTKKTNKSVKIKNRRSTWWTPSSWAPIIIFNKLPIHLNVHNLFKDVDPILQIIVNKDFKIIFSDSKGISELFGLKINDLQGLSINEIKDKGIPLVICETFISLTKQVIESKDYKGFLISIDDIQYICCGFPIVHNKETLDILSIYITKVLYEPVTFDSDFFILK